MEFAEEKRRKQARDAVERYREHYTQFYQESYEEPPRLYNLKMEAEYITNELGLAAEHVWSSFLVERCTGKVTNPAKIETRMKQLHAIIPLIHFVAGLTDRYCLEIFNATHRDFLST